MNTKLCYYKRNKVNKIQWQSLKLLALKRDRMSNLKY
jgi:hypothetical protein